VEAAHVTWRPLGELFVARGLITEMELEFALEQQTSTGKRLGEILVEHGLVSGPDLTSVLMDQLGVEVAKEEGFGSGLWAEIKRRHRRARQHDEDEPEDEDGIDGQPAVALVAPIHADAHEVEDGPEAVPGVEDGLAAEADPEQEATDEELDQELDEVWAAYEAPAPVETLEPEPEYFAEPALELVPDPWATSEPEDAEPASEAEFEPEEEELDETWAEYVVPVPLDPPEPATDTEPEPEFELPELEPAAEAEAEAEAELEHDHEPEAAVPMLELVAQPWFPTEPDAEQEPEPEPAAVEADLQPVAAESGETAALRAELEEAREDIVRLQGMLADAMTALTALSAATGGDTYTG